MSKFTLDIESLAVESFEVATNEAVPGTVKAASDDTGTFPTNTCPATQYFSRCVTGCIQSGIMNCAIITALCAC
jgi:hypothetical protein